MRRRLRQPGYKKWLPRLQNTLRRRRAATSGSLRALRSRRRKGAASWLPRTAGRGSRSRARSTASRCTSARCLRVAALRVVPVAAGGEEQRRRRADKRAQAHQIPSRLLTLLVAFLHSCLRATPPPPRRRTPAATLPPEAEVEHFREDSVQSYSSSATASGFAGETGVTAWFGRGSRKS